MKLFACLLLLLFAFTPAPAQEAAQNPTLADFPIDHFATTSSLADVRFLLDAPAGKHGFIGVSGGHLTTPDGKRVRFWGVNLAGWTTGSALLPPHHDAEVYAATLARLGINCVRFQFLDLTDSQRSRMGGRAAGGAEAPPRQGAPTPQQRPVGGEPQRPAGLIDGSRDDSRTMNPEQLDRLDYLVYQLKLNGIYTNFNLNVGRVYKSGDGVHDYNLIGVAKAITYFDPRLVELQKEYARQLLTHLSPYTKTTYNDEPAIAIVEIVNENSVLEFWQRDWFRGIHSLQIAIYRPGRCRLTKRPRRMADVYRCAAEIRVIVGYLAEQHGAWVTSQFFGAKAAAFLSPVFARTVSAPK